MLDVPDALFTGIGEEFAQELRDAVRSGGGLVDYCVSVMQLLAVVCAGKAPAAIARCQALIPLASCLNQIAALEEPRLKSAFVAFLASAYVDRKWPFPLADAQRAATMLIDTLASAVDERRVAPAWADPVYQVVLPCVAGVLGLHAMEAGVEGGDGESALGAASCTTLLRTLERLYKFAPNREGMAAAASAAHALGKLTSDTRIATSFPGGAPTPDDSSGRTGGGAAAAATPARDAIGTFNAMIAALRASPDVARVIADDFGDGARVLQSAPGAHGGAPSLEANAGALVAMLRGHGEDPPPPRVACAALKMLRNLIESFAPLTTPAAEWSTDDWWAHREPIVAMQKALSSIGTAGMVCRVIATAADDTVLEEALRVGAALTLGGNSVAQAAFRDYLVGDESAHTVWRRLHGELAVAVGVLKKHRKRAKVMVGGIDETMRMRIEIEAEADAGALRLAQTLLRFLQLLCEGHYEPLQTMMPAQAGMVQSFDIVSGAAHLASVLVDAPEDWTMPALQQTLQFIIESMQVGVWVRNLSDSVCYTILGACVCGCVPQSWDCVCN